MAYVRSKFDHSQGNDRQMFHQELMVGKATGASTCMEIITNQWFSTFLSQRTPFGAAKAVVDLATDFLA